MGLLVSGPVSIRISRSIIVSVVLLNLSSLVPAESLIASEARAEFSMTQQLQSLHLSNVSNV